MLVFGLLFPIFLKGMLNVCLHTTVFVALVLNYSLLCSCGSAAGIVFASQETADAVVELPVEPRYSEEVELTGFDLVAYVEVTYVQLLDQVRSFLLLLVETVDGAAPHLQINDIPLIKNEDR